MISENNKIAYSQVIEILKHIPKEEYEKINKKELIFYHKNQDLNYKFNYDVNKTLDEQGVSTTAKVIIAKIYRDYFASNEERNQILEMQEKIRNELKSKMQIDFDSEKIFSSSKNVEEKETERTQIIEVKKENIFKKILKKILKIKEH